VHDLAAQLLNRIMATKPSGTEEIIHKAYESALGRLPEAQETQRMKAFIEQQTQLLGNKPDSATLAMREFCHALLCLNEFIYVD
jgi:hypothetical protein